MKRLVPAVVAVVALAACGSDDDAGSATTEPAPETSVADAASPSATDAGATDTVTTDPETTDTGAVAGEFSEDEYVQAGIDSLQIDDEDVERCLTQATIDAVGFDEIVATGLSPAELFAQPLSEIGLTVPEDRRDDIKATVAGCGDLVDIYVEQGATSEAEQVCAREHFTNELVGEIFVTLLADLPWSDELQAAAAEMDSCLQDNS